MARIACHPGACGQFIELCRRLKLFTQAIVAIDGSKSKAVNNRDKNYSVAKVAKRMEGSHGSENRRPPERNKNSCRSVAADFRMRTRWLAER